VYNFVLLICLGSRSSYDIGRNGQVRDPRGLYLELDRNGRPTPGGDASPLSDNVMFDNQCYATTPSSSNGNSDQDQNNTTTYAGPYAWTIKSMLGQLIIIH